MNLFNACTVLRKFALVVCFGALATASAQTPAPEVWAKDMREEVVRINVTVSDMFGRRETRPMPITVFRPHFGGRGLG